MTNQLHQLPTPNAQLPTRAPLGAGNWLGVGRWALGVAPFVRAISTAVMVIVGSSSVFACPLCFGADETSMIDGTKLGVLVLLAITLVVQGGFVAFFLHLRKRAKRMADVELDTEWSKLQRSPRTS
jgi:hypothetical protein